MQNSTKYIIHKSNDGVSNIIFCYFVSKLTITLELVSVGYFVEIAPTLYHLRTCSKKRLHICTNS